MYFSFDGLTPVEREVQRQQVSKVRCGVCRHRGAEVFAGVFACTKGLAWPEGGPRCRRFELDDKR